VRTYTIHTKDAHGGIACEYNDKYQDTQPCTNPTCSNDIDTSSGQATGGGEPKQVVTDDESDGLQLPSGHVTHVDSRGNTWKKWVGKKYNKRNAANTGNETLNSWTGTIPQAAGSNIDEILKWCTNDDRCKYSTYVDGHGHAHWREGGVFHNRESGTTYMKV
jgi:hypothetical protein